MIAYILYTCICLRFALNTRFLSNIFFILPQLCLLCLALMASAIPSIRLSKGATDGLSSDALAALKLAVSGHKVLYFFISIALDSTC